jgi:hypothetical protein
MAGFGPVEDPADLGEALRAAWETLWMGAVAAVLAYLVGWGLLAGFGAG